MTKILETDKQMTSLTHEDATVTPSTSSLPSSASSYSSSPSSTTVSIINSTLMRVLTESLNGMTSSDPALIQEGATLSSSVGGANGDTWGDARVGGVVVASNETDFMGNSTAELDISESSSHWLTIRLLIVLAVIVCLVVMTWASYSLHRRCFARDKSKSYLRVMRI